MAVELPTIISSSTILNAVVRAAERAVDELGESYFVVISGDFTPSVRVHRADERVQADPLSPAQPIPGSDAPIWKLKLTKGELTDRDAPKLFKDNPPRFFFLSRSEAADYIRSLENLVVDEIKANAAAATKEADQ